MPPAKAPVCRALSRCVCGVDSGLRKRCVKVALAALLIVVICPRVTSTSDALVSDVAAVEITFPDRAGALPAPGPGVLRQRGVTVDAAALRQQLQAALPKADGSTTLVTVELFTDVSDSFHPVLLPGDSGASGEPLSVVSASDDGARAGVQVTMFFGGPPSSPPSPSPDTPMTSRPISGPRLGSSGRPTRPTRTRRRPRLLRRHRPVRRRHRSRAPSLRARRCHPRQPLHLTPRAP